MQGLCQRSGEIHKEKGYADKFACEKSFSFFLFEFIIVFIGEMRKILGNRSARIRDENENE